MEGPSQAKIECDDKGDGSCDVRYWPQEAGEYAVHVLCNSEDIRLSPFMADIREAPQDFHPDRVKGTHHRPGSQPPSASVWGLGWGGAWDMGRYPQQCAAATLCPALGLHLVP